MSSTPEQKNQRTEVTKETVKDLADSFDKEIKKQESKNPDIAASLKRAKNMTGLDFEEFANKKEINARDVRQVQTATKLMENVTEKYKDVLSDSFKQKLENTKKVTEALDQKDFKKAKQIHNESKAKQTEQPSPKKPAPPIPPKPGQNPSNAKQAEQSKSLQSSPHLASKSSKNKDPSKSIASKIRNKLEKAANSRPANAVKGIYSAAKSKANSLRQR